MDAMNRSWETIFHLSKAMNLLLSEALHTDDYDCPKNIATSLCDLLIIINSFVVKSRQKLNNDLPMSSSVNKESHFEREKIHPYNINVNNSKNSQQGLSKEFVEIDNISASSRNSEKNKKHSGSLSLKIYSPVFLSISEKMVSGTFNKGYYCHFCKVGYSDDDKWIEHFNSTQIHQNKEGIRYDKLRSCGICKFHIFAESAEVTNLMTYHECCHQRHHLNMENYSGDPSENSTCGTSVADDSEIDDSASECSSVTENLNNIDERELIKCKTGLRKRRGRGLQNKTKNQEFVKTLNFVNLCSIIDEKNLTNSYYCRPCDKCYFDINQWENHCIKDKHKRFMSSKTFKNFKGICTYCNLVIIGTLTTVQQYMVFHNDKHGKTLSYECDEIINNQITIHKKSRREGLPTARQNSHKEHKNKTEFSNFPGTSHQITEPTGSWDDNDSPYEKSERNKIKSKVIESSV